jgi:hypothetical protein
MIKYISRFRGILIIVKVGLIKIQGRFLDHPILIRYVDMQDMIQ